MNLPGGPEAPEPDPPSEEPKKPEATSAAVDVPKDERDPQILHNPLMLLPRILWPRVLRVHRRLLRP